jgi:hypothetical protein
MHLVAGVSSDMVNRPLPFGAHPGLAATAYRKTAVATPPHFHISTFPRWNRAVLRPSLKFYVNNFSFRIFIKLLENLRLILVNYGPKQSKPANVVFNADC